MTVSLLLLLDFCAEIAARLRLLLIFVGFQTFHADPLPLSLLWPAAAVIAKHAHTRTHSNADSFVCVHMCERVDLRASANALTATWTTNKSKCKIYDEHSNCWRIAESFRCHTHTLCLLHGAHNYPAGVVFTNAPTAGWQLFAVLLGMNFPIFHCENIAVESRCSPCPFWSFFV